MIDAAEKKYGLIGDGTGDNAEAFRKLNDEAAASGQAIRLPPGRYRTSPFGLSSGVALVGESDRNTIIDLYPDTPDGPMVSVDSAERVRLGGITFTAEHCAQGRSQSLVSFAFANRCLFEHCSIVQARGPALTIAYGKHNTARYSYFSGTGPVNGMALWIGNTADAFAVDTVIDHCIFEGVHGCVLVDAGIGTKFANNHISNQMEAAIFTLPSARDYKYLDNTIDTVRGSPAHTDGSYDGASSSGMEIGGWGGLIRGNTIRSTQNGGIDIQSAGDLIVVDNHIYLPGYPRDVRWP